MCGSHESALSILLILWQDCFMGVIGADSMGSSCKPEMAAFGVALQHAGADPGRTAMFEDSVKNLRAAKESLGMTTLLVTGATAAEEGATGGALACCDAIVPVLHEAEVRTALPGLWQQR